MDYYAPAFARLIEEFNKMPGIGGKTAQRLAFYVLGLSEEKAAMLSLAINEAKQLIKYCSICQNITDSDVCNICAASSRDKSIICVVESPKDVIQIEKTHEYNGLYHVLHGALSPMDNIGPDDIKIRELLCRLNSNISDINEVIMANNPNVEGEATAMYISKLIKPMVPRVTRIAHGVPIGGDLEYADAKTLTLAIERRVDIYNNTNLP